MSSLHDSVEDSNASSSSSLSFYYIPGITARPRCLVDDIKELRAMSTITTATATTTASSPTSSSSSSSASVLPLSIHMKSTTTTIVTPDLLLVSPLSSSSHSFAPPFMPNMVSPSCSPCDHDKSNKGNKSKKSNKSNKGNKSNNNKNNKNNKRQSNQHHNHTMEMATTPSSSSQSSPIISLISLLSQSQTPKEGIQQQQPQPQPQPQEPHRQQRQQRRRKEPTLTSFFRMEALRRSIELEQQRVQELQEEWNQYLCTGDDDVGIHDDNEMMIMNHTTKKDTRINHHDSNSNSNSRTSPINMVGVDQDHDMDKDDDQNDPLATPPPLPPLMFRLEPPDFY